MNHEDQSVSFASSAYSLNASEFRLALTQPSETMHTNVHNMCANVDENIVENFLLTR